MEKAVAATNGKVALVKVNIDHGAKIADAQGIEFVPTVRLYRHNCPISEWEGDMTASALGEWIEKYVITVVGRH